MIKLSLLLVTIGRDTLAGMLESLVPQLGENDFLTVISDGIHPGADNIFARYQGRIKAHSKMIQHPENLGFWGHPIRNIYQSKLDGDFIMHCDDDDIYMPGALDAIRKNCTDRNKLYMFRMILDYKRRITVWRDPVIRIGNVGTPQGIIPNNPDIMGDWLNEIGGDGAFYIETEKKLGVGNIVFKEDVIYCVRPHLLGDPLK